MMHLYNTNSRQIELFEPLNSNKVLMYTCGPTVYNYAHIGNLRTYVFEDVLRKTLELFGFEVKQVMNITDVDDKTITNANKNGQTLDAYVSKYIDAFFEDLELLSIQKAAIYPKATDYIKEMIAMIQKLIDMEVAYKGADGSVYFSIEKFPKYGHLSRLKMDALQKGASGRTDNDEYDKETASDFVLWKGYDEKRDGEIYWESPFGKGRPGWHIECSAMATSLLGETIDLHCGGVDNIFPHHENEIAQSECCSGQVFAKYWAHSEHLLVNNQKMSKSLGNFYTLRDLLEKGYLAREVRFLLLQGHYRMQLNFTMDGLNSAKASLQRIDDFMHRLENTKWDAAKEENHLIKETKENFRAALADDLNVAEALAAIFNLIRQANTLADEGSLSLADAESMIAFMKEADTVLSILKGEEDIPADMLELAEKRNKARADKDWAEADRLRDEIDNKGYVIEDSPQGTRLKRK